MLGIVIFEFTIASCQKTVPILSPGDKIFNFNAWHYYPILYAPPEYSSLALATCFVRLTPLFPAMRRTLRSRKKRLRTRGIRLGSRSEHPGGADRQRLESKLLRHFLFSETQARPAGRQGAGLLGVFDIIGRIKHKPKRATSGGCRRSSRNGLREKKVAEERNLNGLRGTAGSREDIVGGEG